MNVLDPVAIADPLIETCIVALSYGAKMNDDPHDVGNESKSLEALSHLFVLIWAVPL